MNVIQCANMHFFDADIYTTCPHCGAGPKTDDPTPATKETSKSKMHIPFFGRKKNTAADNMIQVPDETIGKTFGVLGEESSSGETSEEEGSSSGCYDIPTGGIVLCQTCGTSYNCMNGGICPTCAKKVVETIDDVAVETDTDAETTSLHDAVKKASAGNHGKTVGFFRTGVSQSTATNNDPVVGWLVCIKGPHFGESFTIIAGRNSIGRTEANSIVFSNDNAVSREKHAWLTYEPKRREFFVQPGESSGLSYLNGDIIMESQKIKEKDILEFGDCQYMLIPLCGEGFSWEDYMGKE